MSKHESNETASRARAGTPGAKVGAVLLTFLAAAACMGFSYWLRLPAPDVGPAPEAPRTSLKLPENRALFAGWKKPDLVLVLSAEEHGYLLPCGCSRPQKGGLERRYNFLQILRDKGWPVVAVDLGDVAQAKAPFDLLPNLQQVIKYKYSMLSLKEMGYAAVGVGPIEANNLFKMYGAYALNDDKPHVLSANLRNREKEYSRGTNDPGIEEWTTATTKGSDLTVGVTSIMGAFNTEHRPKNDTVQFDFGGQRLKALQPQAAKSDVHVLLYEGYTTLGQTKDKSEVVACAEAFPEYQVIVALSGENDEPSGTPIPVDHPKTGGKSIVVTLGHKGKYVGVVGVYKTGKKGAPYDLRYQLVELGEEYITPKAEEKTHPILKLMEEYTAELKAEDYLAKYPQRKHPLQVAHPGKAKPEFAGSDQCKGCHAGAFKIWTASAHGSAYKTLVNAQRPSNRQFDPECIVCHTVGFGYDSGFENAAKTAFLTDVGCESCHGPASEHIMAEAGNNADLRKEWRKAINPWKNLPPAQHQLQMEQMCTKCHDIENDVHWTGPEAFAKHWALVKHYKAAPKPAANLGPILP